MAYACEQRDKCGDLAKHCGHARPHEPCRCGSCGTWCAQSNALCGGGLCTQMHMPAGTVRYKPTFPVRCVELPPPAEKQEEKS